jgi:hypothetical protein
MGILGSLIGLFTGGIGKPARDGLLNLVRVYITDDDQRARLEAEVTTKWIEAQVESSLVRKDAWGKWSALFAGAFLVGPLIWWTGVFLASTFPSLGLVVLALPKDFYPWFTTILGAIFFAPSINGVITRFLKK